MTKSDVVEKIAENGGSWVSPRQIVFTQEDDGTIYAKAPTGMLGFLLGVNEDWSEFHFVSSFGLFDAQKVGEFIQFGKDLADVLGITFEIPGAESVERVVRIRDEKEEARLLGNVEAYEKILLRRPMHLT